MGRCNCNNFQLLKIKKTIKKNSTLSGMIVLTKIAILTAKVIVSLLSSSQFWQSDKFHLHWLDIDISPIELDRQYNSVYSHNDVSFLMFSNRILRVCSSWTQIWLDFWLIIFKKYSNMLFSRKKLKLIINENRFTLYKWLISIFVWSKVKARTDWLNYSVVTKHRLLEKFATEKVTIAGWVFWRCHSVKHNRHFLQKHKALCAFFEPPQFNFQLAI